MRSGSRTQASGSLESDWPRGCDGAGAGDSGRSLPPTFDYSARGPGPLGLTESHREMADLIRSCEVLTVAGDDQALRDSARRVVQTLVRHTDDESTLLNHMPTPEGRLEFTTDWAIASPPLLVGSR